MAAAGPIGFSVGRVRVTRAAQPSEAGYIRSIHEQMKAIEQNLLALINRIENVTPEALEFGLLPVFERSQELVPVDTGRLKASGFIETRQEAQGTSAVVGYGRFGIPAYAGFVHEMLDIPHAPPTQAKFLETAINEKMGDFERRVGFFIAKETGIKP